MAKEQIGIKEREQVKTAEPRNYEVIMHNDDVTTMDFVVDVLQKVFFKKTSEAEALMLTIHQTGLAVVGIYSYDIALSKIERATDMARRAHFPLRLTYQPAGQ